MVQLARQLRVLALNVEKHQEPVHLLGALRHAVRGGRAVGALDMELLGQRQGAARSRLAQRHRRLSMFIVPAKTKGVEIVRSVGLGVDEMDLHDPERNLPGGDHAYMRYHSVRVPLDHMLGGRGDGFLVAQTRLSGGRIHYGMRTIGFCKRALDMMCERGRLAT